ncbi:hypothetical protein THOM_0020 [Trachipleistophora hominis]|uniref:Uncharacterized protein n=1 Tax=Trachipleistophora hominis TaxID=72359 RepID=L7JZV5_TRAHO|nr:hypothetical protein THOM_0020 [Trachipleistophora hominis]
MESTRKVCQRYNLTRPIFALHLNPKDQMMNISFSFYVNLGFVNVAYVNDGPYDLQFDVEKISTKWDEIQDRPASGRYLAMFCFDGLGTGVKGDFREVGENIRGKLLQFGEENKKTTEKAAT